MTWTDSKNNLWLFGGEGYGKEDIFGNLNDLWRFDTNINEWTWITGSNQINQVSHYGQKGVESVNNVLGARSGGMTWIDNGNYLYLFGGEQKNIATNKSELMSDLWRFDFSSGLWTWINGAQEPSVQSNHGKII
jgi:N-acetylneuraminic acid mutarotase